MDPLLVGSGPGLGGIYRLDGAERVPLFGKDALRGQRVVEDGPLRCEVAIDVAARGTELTRQWQLTGGDEAILESLAVVRTPGDSVTLALAMPKLEFAPALGPRGLVVFGRSDPGGPAFGLAGRVIDANPSSLVEIDGHLAMKVRVAAGDTLRAAWLAGTATNLDTWKSQALEQIDRSAQAPIRCTARRR